MYSAVANALTTMPATIIGTAIANPPASGSHPSDTSTATAMTTTLLTVPNPGFCRSGIHASNTRTPVTAVIAPKLSGTCRPTPW